MILIAFSLESDSFLRREKAIRIITRVILGKLLRSYWEVIGKLLGSYWEVVGKLMGSCCKLLGSYWKASEKLLGSC